MEENIPAPAATPTAVPTPQMTVPQPEKKGMPTWLIVVLVLLGLIPVLLFVLGILASVVLVAINPAARIKEAQDSEIKNDVSQVATAAEAFRVVNETYFVEGLPVTIDQLVAEGYIKADPGTVSIRQGSGDSLEISGALESDVGCPDNSSGYYVYYTMSADAQTVCVPAR